MSIKQFMVVGSSEASAIIPIGQNLEVAIAEGGKISFSTKYIREGFEVPVPTRLQIEAVCYGTSINEAVERIGDTIQALQNAIELSINAWLGDLDVELVYERFSGPGKRDFFQSFVPITPISAVASRRVDLSAASELITKIHTHIERRRLAQAVAQYHEALRRWTRGNELVCLEHLYMGIESLNKAALREHLRKTNKSEGQLATEWGYIEDGRLGQSPFLEAQSRIRLIFKGNSACARQAATVSNGFEHGFQNLAVLKRTASQIVVTVANYLRNAILEYSGLSPEKYQSLTTASFSPRGRIKLIKYMWGHLNSESDQLAAEGSAHPYCKWTTRTSQISLNELGNYVSSPTDNITPVIAPGVSLTPERHEVWDGSSITERPSP